MFKTKYIFVHFWIFPCLFWSLLNFFYVKDTHTHTHSNTQLPSKEIPENKKPLDETLFAAHKHTFQNKGALRTLKEIQHIPQYEKENHRLKSATAASYDILLPWEVFS